MLFTQKVVKISVPIDNVKRRYEPKLIPPLNILSLVGNVDDTISDNRIVLEVPPFGLQVGEARTFHDALHVASIICRF